MVTSKTFPLLYCLSLVFALRLNKATCCVSAHIYILYIVSTFISLFLSKRECGETSSEFSFQSDYASNFCLEQCLGSPA